ncbi:MAG: AsmA family protein [Alphaproteobacteria bacterium]|nr:AsmA family protein [Alphaproteobacteria bacterium]
MIEDQEQNPDNNETEIADNAPESSVVSEEETAEPEDESLAPEKPRKKRFGWLIPLVLYSSFFLFILFTVLANLGGSSDVLKESIEQYLSENTNYTAHVGKLNAMHFFPEIAVDLENLELRDVKTGDVAIYIGKAQISIGFFDVTFKRQRFRSFSIQDMRAAAGSLLGKPLSFEYIGLRKEEEGAFLAAEGNLDGRPLSLKIAFNPQELADRGVYTPMADMQMILTLGEIVLEGVLKRDPKNDITLDGFKLRSGDQEVLTGTLALTRLGGDKISLKGRMDVLPHKTVLHPDLVLDLGHAPPLVQGQVKAGLFNTSDFLPAAPAIQIGDFLLRTLGPFDPALDIDLNLENFTVGEVDWGTVETKLTKEAQHLTIAPLSGEIMNGALSGKITLDSTQPLENLSIQIGVQGFDYAALQRQFDLEAEIEGRADIGINLKAEGENPDALLGALRGKISFIAGEGHIRTGALALWGAGLPGAVLPGMDNNTMLDLRCAVIDLDVENAIARTGTILADTAQATVQMSGQYDFQNDLLEMNVHSRINGDSVLKQPFAAHVKGAWGELGATKDTFGINMDAGAMAGDAAGPDFKFSGLPGLPLAADHPCRAHMIEAEILEAPPIESPPAESPAIIEGGP